MHHRFVVREGLSSIALEHVEHAVVLVLYVLGLLHYDRADVSLEAMSLIHIATYGFPFFLN